MSKLSDTFLDELRARADIVTVVSRRLPLKRAGGELKALCPFHNERTPSFHVSPQKGFVHCFGCSAHEDAIGFVMRYDKLDFMEAVERLAGEVGLPIPQASPEDKARVERRHRLLRMVDMAAAWFEEQLRTSAGERALAYLRSRGLSDDTIARFRLGYAPKDGGALKALLSRAGYSEADMVEVGLFKRPDDGRSPYAFFRNRVMFPVTDRLGRVVAFGARILDGEGPKYINSGETPLFHKGSLLYNVSAARQAAANGKPMIVVEGYMDVIACVVAGFEGAVAPLGTALTEAQIQELWKLQPHGRRSPILCFDGDNAGLRAATRAVERILPLLLPDHTATVAFLPSGEDPDSLIAKGGAAAFQQVLDRAQPLVDVLWEMIGQGRDVRNPDDRAAVEKAIDENTGTIRHASVRSSYRSALRGRMWEIIKASSGSSTNSRPGWRPATLPRPTPAQVRDNARQLAARFTVPQDRQHEAAALLLLARHRELLLDDAAIQAACAGTDIAAATDPTILPERLALFEVSVSEWQPVWAGLIAGQPTGQELLTALDNDWGVCTLIRTSGGTDSPIIGMLSLLSQIERQRIEQEARLLMAEAIRNGDDALYARAEAMLAAETLCEAA